jgi:exopolysaccharide production protein ExoY
MTRGKLSLTVRVLLGHTTYDGVAMSITELVNRNDLVSSHVARPIGGGIKRTFDVLASLFGILVLLPLLIGCCLVTFGTSPGPILFRHRRTGLGGKEFNCLKFRTMEVDAERKLREYLAADPDARHEWLTNHKLQNDPRVTPFGRFMRRSSLDELPQLFNVLFGDMSLVGPRPIIRDEVEKYRESFRVYASGRPGLTGLWQVKGRNSTTYAERVAYDVYYFRNWSFGRDLAIILSTVIQVCRGRGAC